MNQPVQILSAPSILGLRPTGVEDLPQSLYAAGLLDKIQTVETVIDIPTLNSEYNSHRDPVTHCLNPVLIRDFSVSLMKEVGSEHHAAAFPLVLGGDCSILIGIMAGLKTRGPYGLIFLDAHADFYQPEKSTTGEVADMDLAIVTGRGPRILTDIGHLQPYVADKHVIHIGQRDAQEARQFGSQDIRQTAIQSFDLDTIQSVGLQHVLAGIVDYIVQSPLDGFWIHFDTDVISDQENPAVDYRLPGGLTFDEVGHLLRGLMLDVTIFNPALDKDGEIAAKISDCLAYSFN
jgi:arginase